MMLCSAFALTAVLTYRGGEQNSIYNGDHADVTGTVIVTDGTQESTETTRAADTTAAPKTEAPAETVTTSAVIDTYIPIAPEAPEPEEDKDSVNRNSGRQHCFYRKCRAVRQYCRYGSSTADEHDRDNRE